MYNINLLQRDVCVMYGEPIYQFINEYHPTMTYKIHQNINISSSHKFVAVFNFFFTLFIAHHSPVYHPLNNCSSFGIIIIVVWCGSL